MASFNDTLSSEKHQESSKAGNNQEPSTELIRRPLHLSCSSGGITSTRLVPWTVDFVELSHQFQRPADIGPKNGSYFVRGPTRVDSSDRADANLERSELIILDGDSSLDPATGEIRTGAPPPIDVFTTLVQLDVAHLIYSTHSHRQNDKGHRYRVLIPAVIYDKDELNACVSWLIGQLHTKGCWLADVRENSAWAQPWYFPRVTDEAAEYFCYAHYTGQPFDVQAAVASHQACRELFEEFVVKAATPPPARDPDSIFLLFNEQHGNPEWMLQTLEDNGYTFAGTAHINGGMSYRLLSPYSTSGNPGIVLFRHRDGIWRVYSHHNADDPLTRPGSKVKTNDAWDLYRVFEHEDDQQAALEAWQKELGNRAALPAVPSDDSLPEDIEKAQPLDPSGFPNQRHTPSGKIILPATIANIRHMLEGYGIQALYDVIGKKVELRVPGTSGCPENVDNSALTHVCSLATWNEINVSMVPHYVAAIADTHQFNPVVDYITRSPWDGKDRLVCLFRTLEVRDDYPEDLKIVLLRRWLISAVAAVYQPTGFRSRGVLVLQGPQAIGKTTFFLSLVDDPVLRERLIKIDQHLDAANKDTIITAVSHWIVEIGELDSSFKKDVARLKGFITGDTDKVRRPYDRKDSEYPRRTVFCASVNQANFLVDDSGNSRWWTIPVTAIDYNHNINMQQLWSQVLTLYQAGEQWWLNPDEERQLEAQNCGHRAVNAVRDILESELDTSLPEADWQLMTATDVLQTLGIKNPSNAQARDCGAYLRDVFGEPTRSKGKTRWQVPLKRSDFIF